MTVPRIGDRGNVLIALMSETRIVLVREPWQRPPQRLKLPGGGIEEYDKTREDAAARELWEETGIRFPAKDLKLLALAQSPSKWDSSSTFTRYLYGAFVSEEVIDSRAERGPHEGEWVYAEPLSVLETEDFYSEHYKFLSELKSIASTKPKSRAI